MEGHSFDVDSTTNFSSLGFSIRGAMREVRGEGDSPVDRQLRLIWIGLATCGLLNSGRGRSWVTLGSRPNIFLYKYAYFDSNFDL